MLIVVIFLMWFWLVKKNLKSETFTLKTMDTGAQEKFGLQELLEAFKIVITNYRKIKKP